MIKLKDENTNITINGKTKTLSQYLLDYLNKLKISTAYINDNNIVSYYKSFFNSFPLNQFLNISFISNTQTSLWTHSFSESVKDLDTMIDYLDKLPSLYAKLCLWCIQNLFSKTTSTRIHKHHIMPKFLIDNYGCLSKNINASYNLVTVDWLMHYILHFVRLLEWGQDEDDFALKALIGLKKKRKKLWPSIK